MHLHTSNRAEHLVTRLAEVLRRPSGGPFEPEVVMVHSPGMGTWLKQRLAQNLGVCAHVEFPFPNRFLPELFDAVLPTGDEEAAKWTRSRVRWAVLAELFQHLEHEDFKRVRRYLVDSAREVDPLKALQLATRIARVFVGYLYYRPAMILRWQSGRLSDGAGNAERWQARLWVGVRRRLDSPNVVELSKAFQTQLRAATASPPPVAKPAAKPAPADGQLSLFGVAPPKREPQPVEAPVDIDLGGLLPGRICLFGVSSLPPLQLEILGELARYTEVHLFVVAPSREFFGDIRDKGSIARAARSASVEDAHLTVGSPLLASMGRLGRDFQSLLHGSDLSIAEFDEHYVDPTEVDLRVSGTWQTDLFPARASALQVLQSDILNLRHRGPEHEPFELHPDDHTVAVHACHSPMRQVEVLHDQVLDLFRRDGTLTPADVLVMCPDLETYGPLVEAVFGRPKEDPRNVPFRIADRSIRRDSPAAEAFLGALDLMDSRFGAARVMDLLSIQGVHRHFGITSDELPTIARWIGDVGIRWGIDAEHRTDHGQPPYEENTWRFGLDRLLLGAAMRGDGLRVFRGVLPFDDIEGSASELAGRFTAFAQTLFSFETRLRDPRSLGRWRDDLSALLEQLVHLDDDVAWAHEQIRRILNEAADDAESVGLEVEIPLSAIRNLMRSALTDGRSAYGFLTGSVTFCEMLPMRAIPFRVVCMLGMDERAFPRAGSRLGFDLVALDPKVGDRSNRDDDRYLFLEALLSARDRVLITYTGQSVRDNSPLPPSVVVSELLDACEESFSDPTNEEFVDRNAESFVTVHGLQPFSEIYFRSDEPAHFTYAHEFHSGAASLRAPRAEAAPFVSSRTEPAESSTTVAVHELVRFFRDPVRAFFNDRLGVYLRDDNVALIEREPIVLDRLQSSILAGRMLDRAAGGHDLSESFEATKGEGALPLGEPGGTKYDSLVASVGPLERALDAVRVVEEPGFRGVDLTIGDVNIVGRVHGIFGGRLVKHQYSRVRGDHELMLWVQHLVLCALGGHRESVLVGRPPRHSVASQRGSAGLDVEVTRYRAVEDAERHLAALLALWKDGRREPLLLFPTLGLIWQENVESRRDRWREVNRAWDGSGPIPGLKENPYAKAMLCGTPPFQLDRPDAARRVMGALPSRPELGFSELAQTVFQPMLEARER